MFKKKYQNWYFLFLAIHIQFLMYYYNIKQYILITTLMNPVSFRYRFIDSFNFTKIRLVIGNKSVEAKVAGHSIFSQVKQIHLKSDELNLKYLQLVQKGEVSIVPQQSRNFVKRCKQVFGLDLILNVQQIGATIMLNKNEQDFQVLDLLEFNQLLDVIKCSFDKMGVKLHPKILRKLKNYSNATKRRQEQKQILLQIIKSYKQTQNIQQQSAPAAQQKVYQKAAQKVEKKTQVESNNFRRQQRNDKKNKQQNQVKKIQGKAETSNNKRQQNQIQDEQILQQSENKNEQVTIRFPQKQKKGKKNNRNEGEYYDRLDKKRNSRNKSMSKEKSFQKFRDNRSKQNNYDPSILLGIVGDSQFGWRQRHRPQRVPRVALDVQSQNTQGNTRYKQKKFPNQRQQRQEVDSNKKKSSNSYQSEKNRKQEKSSQNLVDVNKNSQKKQKRNQKNDKEDQNDWEDVQDAQKVQDVQESQQKQGRTKQNKKFKPKVAEQKKDQKPQKQQASQQKKNEQPKQKKRLSVPAQTLKDGQKLVFSFPKDGNKFNFNTVKNEFKMLVNQKFWVNFKNNILEIKKGENGYVRQSKIDIISNTLTAEGLTLNLQGNSNIQDGGDTIGNPTIQDFTQNNSQFFHVTSLDVYAPSK